MAATDSRLITVTRGENVEEVVSKVVLLMARCCEVDWLGREESVAAPQGVSGSSGIGKEEELKGGRNGGC